jgi:hypothetical protein
LLYKVTAVQELKQTDNETRMRYCCWFQQFITNNNHDILGVTFFTDEAWFHLYGYINSQNSRVWSAHNPQFLQQTALHRQKVEVWVAISRKWMIGPIFFYNSSTSDRYCNDILYPFIVDLYENEINNAWFQQDSATAHTAGQSMPLLSEIFGYRSVPDHLI